MGHERVGNLPKSEKWESIINDIVSFDRENHDVTEIVENTLHGVHKQFKNLQSDKSVFNAFKFLLLISISGRKSDPFEYLEKYNILLNSVGPFDIAKALSKYINKTELVSKEYESIVKSSANDAIAKWFDLQSLSQKGLFNKNNNLELLYKSATGSGFCEFSRLFLSNIVERYLKYFIEREASSSVQNIYDRNLLNYQINKYINKISKHSFETTKITQSYSAGWFNKYAKTDIPSDIIIRDHLNYLFGKLNGELLREAEND